MRLSYPQSAIIQVTTVLISAAFALGSYAIHPRVVIAARYYNPPGSKRPTSRTNLYLIERDGTRRLLSHHPGQDIFYCRWIARGTSSQGRVIYSLRKRDETQDWIVDVANGGKRLLGKRAINYDEGDFEGRFSVPGFPAIYDARYPRLFPTVVKVAGFQRYHGEESKGQVSSSLDPSRIVKWDSSHYWINEKKEPIPTVEYGGVNYYNWVSYDKIMDTVWFCQGSSLSTWGLTFRISRLNWTTGLAETVIRDGQDIDWWPRSDWAAYTTHRDTSPYGPNRDVWTSMAFLKNIRTNKLWTVAKGLVEVRSASVEPH